MMSKKNRNTSTHVSHHWTESPSIPLALALEPRFMFDAAGAATAADAAVDRAAQDSADAAITHETDATSDHTGDAASDHTGYEVVREAAPAVNDGRKEAVFVDGALADRQDLIDGLGDGVEIVILDDQMDGLAQIAAWADAHAGAGYDAIHVLSHGAEGKVYLGTMTLDGAAVETRAADLATVGTALAEDGDILLYGCRVASGEGQAFADALAQATGADVAASTDPTGATTLGGDWDLEYTVGTLDSTPYALSYGHLLATDTMDGASDSGDTVSSTVDGVSYTISSGGNSWLASSAFSPAPDESDPNVGGSFYFNMNQSTYTFTFASPVSLTSIGLMDMSSVDSGGANITFSVTDSSGNSDVQFDTDTMSNLNINGYNYDVGTVTLNWTNVTSFTVSGASGKFGFDNVVASSGPPTAAPSVDIDGGTGGDQTTYTAAFSENSHQGTTSSDGVLVTNGTTLGDGDGDGIATIVVTLDNSQGDTGERLFLSGSFTNVTYTLDNDNQITITNGGGATYAQMAAALDAVRYQNNSDAPDTTNRTVSIAVTDDNAGPKTTTATTTVTVAAGNDAPIITDSASVSLGSTNENGTSSAKTVSSLLTGAAYADGDSGAASGIAVTGLVGNGTWQYSTDGTIWTAMGTVSGSSALLLSSTTQVRYVPDDDNGETATFSFRAWDQTSGTASTNGSPSTGDASTNGGTSAFSSGAATASLTVTDVNDAPTLTNGASVNLATTNEDTTSSATTVSSLLTDASYADVDSGATSGIAVTSLSGNGTWQYSTDGTTWTNMGTVSGAAALLLSSSTQVRYIPDNNNGETASFSFRAWDQTSGTASTNGSPSTGDTSTNGGTSAFSSGSASAGLTVTAVNDAPTITSNGSGATASVNVAENTTAVTTVTATDPDTSATQTYSIVGGADAAKFSIDSSTGVLTFASAPNYEAPTDSDNDNVYEVTVQVSDGSLTDQQTLSVTVTDANETPAFSGLDGSPTTNERTPVTLDSDVTVTDPEMAALNGGNGDYAGASLTIVRNGGTDATDSFGFDTSGALFTVSGGNLQAGGQTFATFTNTGGTLTISFTSGQTAATQALVNDVLQRVQYTNTATAPPASAQLDWSFSDGNSTDSGSTTVSITAINNGPLFNGLDGAPTTNEQTTVTLDSGVTASDAELGALNGGNGDYAGASLTITRDGGADATDSFGFDTSGALFTVSGGNLQSGGQTFATFTNTGGTLTITFTSGQTAATQALVNDVLQRVQYTNTSDAPPASVQLNWSFSDGNSGSQGIGGSGSDMGSTNVTLTPVNDAPAIGTLDGDTVNYSIGGSAITLDGTPALTVTDADNATLASATIQITGQYQSGEDVLGFVNDGGTMGNIAGSYDAGTGTLTLTSAGATATTAQWAAALKAVTYNNTDSSTSNTSTRTVTWTVNDGDTSSAAATTTVSLVRAPIIDLDGDDSSGGTNGGYTGTFTEGGGAVAVADSDSTISDDGTFKSLTVTLTNHPDGTSESLYSTYSTGAHTINGEAITISAYNTATGELTITVDDGATDAATMQMIMESIRYTNASDAPDTTPRSITFAATDNDDNTGSSATATINVTAVNDAPTITDGATPTLTATSENATSSATTVASLLSSASYADADSSAASGIAVTGLVGNGTWQYSTDGTTWTAMGSVSGSAALLLSSTTQVRYVPDGDNGETATLSYRAWDQTSGTASTDGTPHRANITTHGGTSAFSSGTATASLTVTDVNDAPTITDGTSLSLTTTDEATTSSATTVSSLLTSASLADVDSSAASGIAVTGLVGNGTWQYSTDGTTWRAMGTVSGSAALLLSSTTQIRYIPDGDNGETATLSYRAWDQTAGSASTNTTPQAADTTTNGGSSAFSSGTATADLSVTAINDAPTITDGANLTLTTTTEDATSSATTVSSLLTSTSYGDVDNGTASGIAITGLVGNGTWQYSTDGSTWTAMGTVSGSAALLLSSTTQIRYVPDGDNGETATLSYRAWDQTTGTASTNSTHRSADTTTNGGTSAFSSGAATATLTVTDVNDAPVASDLLGDAEPPLGKPWKFPVPESLIQDVDTGDTLTWTATTVGGGALPAWLSFDPATRIFSGTAAETPATQIVVTATDSMGAKASVSFTLTVTAPAESSAPATAPTTPSTPPPQPSIPAPPPGTESGGQVTDGQTDDPATDGIGGPGLASDIGNSSTPVQTAIGNAIQGRTNGPMGGTNGSIGSPVVGRLGSVSSLDNSGTPVSQSISGLGTQSRTTLGGGAGAPLGGGFGGGGLSGGLGVGGGFGGPQTGPADGQGPVTGPEGPAPEPDAGPDATDQQADTGEDAAKDGDPADSAATAPEPTAPDLAVLGASPFTRQLAVAHGLASPHQGSLAAILAAYQPPDRAA